jgi:hypothetical protein
MGTSLLSASEKSQLNAAFDDIHETFAREITVYKEASQIVIITDPNFNPLYNTAGQTTSYVNTPIYRTFKARIFYNDDFTKDYWTESKVEGQFKMQTVTGSVRIKMRAEDYDFIKEGIRFDIDGKRFVLISSLRPHGLIGVQYYTIYLKPDP